MKTPNSFLSQEDSTVTFQVQALEHLGFLLGRDRAMKPPTQKPALTQHRKLFQIQWVGAEGERSTLGTATMPLLLGNCPLVIWDPTLC